MVVGILLFLVILLLVAITIVAPNTTAKHYNRIVNVNVEDSMPRITHKAKRDWAHLETEVKQIHKHSTPAHLKPEVIRTLHIETPA